MSSRKSSRRYARCEPLETRLVLANPVVIDLLAVYTPAAATQVGGDPHVRALIQGSVDAMNRALMNTGLSVVVRTVHSEPIAYASSGDVFTDRQRLETPGDGYMDSVFSVRDAYGADLVALISDGFGGGNANLMTSTTDPNNADLAFSATFVSALGPGNLTLAHELGHNLGGGHELNNPTQPAVGPFPYAVGYRFNTASPSYTASFNDVMSYGYGSDIPLFQYANPALSANGTPTGKPVGDPLQADLYSTFLQTAPIVAAYRPTAVADTVAPTGFLFETQRTGSVLTFTVRYADDSGLDLSTIGAGDILVSGPGGFAVPAAFVSMDNPAVSGAFKLATYRVVLPVTNPPTDSLTFTLQSGAVWDVFNHPAAAGAIVKYSGYFAGAPSDAAGQHAAYAWARPLGATLTPGTSFTEYGALSPDDPGHFYSFTLTQSATVSASLTGLSGNADLFIAADTNHNALLDHDDLNNVETLTDSGYNDGSVDEGVGLTLPAGTYYVYTYVPFGPVTTTYALTVRAIANDVTPPTAVADTKDLYAAAPYLDFAVTYADDFDVDGVSVRFDTAVDIHGVLDNGFTVDFYYYPDFNLNPYYFANAQTKTIYYRIFPFGSDAQFYDWYNGTYTLSIRDATPRAMDAAGNLVSANLVLGTYRIKIAPPATTDTILPTASLAGSTTAPVPGTTAWQFTVAYRDNLALNLTTFDNNDVRVTGPNGYNQLATFVSQTQTTDIGNTRLVTYSVPAPGAYWDSTDAGNYTVAVQANQVRDQANNAAAAVSFPAINFASPHITTLNDVASPLPLGFVGTAGHDTMRVDGDATFVYLTLNDSLLYFVPRTLFSRLSVSGLGGDDAFVLQSGTFTASLSPGTGNNSLSVTGGSLTVRNDAGDGSTLSAALSGSGALTFASSIHFISLTLADSGRATLAAGGTKTLFTKALSISGSAALDVTDNAVLLDYTGATPLSTIRGYLLTGYAAGTWTGPGIRSSSAGTTTNRSIGYAEALVLGLGSHAGEPVDPTALLLRYTRTGDANLSGTINADDYALTDRGQLLNSNTWVFGDFNYDGQVNAADVTLLNQSAASVPAPILAPAPLVTMVATTIEPIPTNATGEKTKPTAGAVKAKPKKPKHPSKTTTRSGRVTTILKAAIKWRFTWKKAFKITPENHKPRPAKLLEVACRQTLGDQTGDRRREN